MNPDLRKRLENIELRLGSNEDKSGVVFIQFENETREDMKSRIDRWYEGEKVEGQEKIYAGGNPIVMSVVFVKTKKVGDGCVLDEETTEKGRL